MPNTPPSPPDEKEKQRRIYYQTIVYSVCNLLDQGYTGSIVCGTIEEPSTECQDVLSTRLDTERKVREKLVDELEKVIGYISELATRYYNPEALDHALEQLLGPIRDVLASAKKLDVIPSDDLTSPTVLARISPSGVSRGST